jgi:putative acetyltransferase
MNSGKNSRPSADAPQPLPPGFRLRPAVAADSADVRDLVFRVLREYGLVPSPADTDADLDNLEQSYIDPGGWFGVVEAADGQVVGCAGLLPVTGTAVELRKMYLTPGVRGRGVGRALLAAALQEAKRRGFGRVTLETATVLKEAVRLYESVGFRPRAGAVHACRCDLAMELDLHAASQAPGSRGIDDRLDSAPPPGIRT